MIHLTLTGAFYDSRQIKKLDAGALILDHTRNGSESGKLVSRGFRSCVRAFAKERGLYQTHLRPTDPDSELKTGLSD